MDYKAHTAVRCLRPTTDNFHPNFKGDKVEVYMGLARPSDDAYFVGVRGDDDEIWAGGQGSIYDAAQLYIAVTALPVITKDQLASMGLSRS